MRITAIRICNYRTFEDVRINLDAPYVAVCGPNDSGKTNVVRAIRTVMHDEYLPHAFLDLEDREGPSLTEDYPKWATDDPSGRAISIELSLSLDQARDGGVYQFITKQLQLTDTPPTLAMCLKVTYRPEAKVEVVIDVPPNTYTGIDAQEVLKKFQSAGGCFFHNSTQSSGGLFYSGKRVVGHVRELTGSHDAVISQMKRTVDRTLKKISKKQQAEFAELLGRLTTRYRVGLSLPPFDFSYFPFSITLGDAKVEVPLDDWGSGTRNRTLVLLALFRAKAVGNAELSAGKITPVLVIEEPESFLHPAAQAEFGRVLQDLAEEFLVQVIVTTHSPYLLSLNTPSANVLLRRHMHYRAARHTEVVDTSGSEWMQPFAEALALEPSSVAPWQDLILGGAGAVLLVEGDVDKDYFQMLRGTEHGSSRLDFDGEIVPYGGKSALLNTALLRFVKNRHPRMFITYDLDGDGDVRKPLTSLKFVEKQDFLPIGRAAAGKMDIEGLLPERIVSAVYATHTSLVQTAIAASAPKAQRESAKNSLKRLLFDEFKASAVPGKDDFGAFYDVCKVINRALRGSPPGPQDAPSA